MLFRSLELALMAGDISIWDVDLRTMKVRDIDQWLYRTLGYQPADLPNITVSVCKNLIHPMDIPRVLAAFLAHMSGVNPLLETQFRLACKDGSWRWVTVRCKVIEWGDSKEPIRFTGTVNTIAPPR